MRVFPNSNCSLFPESFHCFFVRLMKQKPDQTKGCIRRNSCTERITSFISRRKRDPTKYQSHNVLEASTAAWIETFLLQKLESIIYLSKLHHLLEFGAFLADQNPISLLTRSQEVSIRELLLQLNILPNLTLLLKGFFC